MVRPPLRPYTRSKGQRRGRRVNRSRRRRQLVNTMVRTSRVLNRMRRINRHGNKSSTQFLGRRSRVNRCTKGNNKRYLQRGSSNSNLHKDRSRRMHNFTLRIKRHFRSTTRYLNRMKATRRSGTSCHTNFNKPCCTRFKRTRMRGMRLCRR